MAKFTPQNELSLTDQVKVRRQKLAELQAQGKDPFVQTKFDADTTTVQIRDNFEALEGSTVRIAGRLMSKRGMGKVVFCDLQDLRGRIQLYVKIDEMDEESFLAFRKNDIGDIVGVVGDVFRTQRGEISSRIPSSATASATWI